MESIREHVENLSYNIAGPHRRSWYTILDLLIGNDTLKDVPSIFRRLVVLKAYSLAQDEEIEEAEEYLKANSVKEIFEEVKDHKVQRIMLENTLKVLDRIEDLEMVCDGRSLEEKYEVEFLRGKYAECKKTSSKLIRTEPNLGMMALLAEWKESSAGVVLMLLEKMEATSKLVRALYKKGMKFRDLEKYVDRIEKKDTAYYLLMKDLLTGGVPLEKYFKNPCEEILAVLDDWEVYSYALSHKIEIKEREKSVNYLRYAMEKDPTADNISKFATSLRAVEISQEWIRKLPENEMARFLSLVPDSVRAYVSFVVYGRVVALESVSSAPYLLGSSSCFIFLIGNILAKKRDEDILTAYILCYLHKDRYPDSFEVSFILCLLHRYFLMYNETARDYVYLDISTIQLENLTYIWHDIHLVLDKHDKLLTASYTHTRKTMISQINTHIASFIKKGEFSQVLSLIKMKEALVHSKTNEQIETQKIVARAPSSIETLLVEPARYVFRKLTSKTVPQTDKTLTTIDSFPRAFSEKSVQSLFNGALQAISKYLENSLISQYDILDLSKRFIESQKQAHAALSRSFS